MTLMLLARHGETDWNRDRRLQGSRDTPLNDAGRAQAALLARELAGEALDAVYASDLSRALETARAVAAPRGLPVAALPELRERDFGTWEGLTDDEILARHPAAATGAWGDAETPEQLADRVLRAAERIAGAHPGGRVLVVAHDGPIRAVLRACGDGAAAIGHCDVVRVSIEQGRLRLP